MSTEASNVDRVVFDTNVLVSATLSRGKPYTVLELAERGDIDSVMSPDIIDELEDVLSRERDFRLNRGRSMRS